MAGMVRNETWLGIRPQPKQPEISFWKTHHESIKTRLSVAATTSIGYRASLYVDLVPVEPPLRLRQGRTEKFASKLHNMTRSSNAATTYWATAQQHESDDGACTIIQHTIQQY